MAILQKNWGNYKPADNSQVIWGHPIAYKLANCWLFNSPSYQTRDIANNIKGTITSPVNNQIGLKLDGTKNSAVQFGSQRPYYVINGTPFTYVTEFTPLGAPTGNHALYNHKDYDGSTNGGPYWRFHTDGTLHLLRSQEVDYGSVAMSGYTVGKKYTFAVTCTASGAVRMYENGKDKGGFTGATSFKIFNFGQSFGTIGTEYLQFSSGQEVANGIIRYFYVFSRVLNPSEIAELYTNPFCFIRPPSYWQIDMPSVGGVTYNATRMMLGMGI